MFLSNSLGLLTTLPISLLPGFQERLIPYLARRGVQDRAIMEALVREDLHQIAQSLDLFFNCDPRQVLIEFLGSYSHLLDGCDSQMDHVGKELFGPLSFYLPILEEMSSKIGLTCFSGGLFPSVSVAKRLQKEDPHLKGVTISRVYFRSRDKEALLELFQTAPVDEKEPQNIETTQCRRSLLADPIDHLAIRFNTVEAVEAIHKRIQGMASEHFFADLDEVSYNQGDKSFHTKARFMPYKVIEFVHYENC